ncbi:hypothetical protein [Plesiocystis pacifica]|nr:hypothetical protein [Plesiocystis pacifica]
MSKTTSCSRRRMLAGLGGLVGAAALGAALPPRRAAAEETDTTVDPADRRLLFVVCASGGASLIDSFLPVSVDEVPDGVDASTLNVYPSELIAQPGASTIRCVRPIPDTSFLTPGYAIETFLEAHYESMTVLTHEVTSVNHNVAQKRAMTGAGINGGRTIAEAVSARYGLGMPLANCNMGYDGYLEPGTDRYLPSHARAEVILNPRTYALSTHGSRGITSPLDEASFERVRAARGRLDQVSPFGITYRDSPLRQDYVRARDEVGPQLESMDAITKLMLLDADGPEAAQLGLSPMLDTLRATFPQLDSDIWQQQSALSFLLSFFGLSCANTVALEFNPSFEGDDLVGAPLAFDYSHVLHRPSQSVMWGRTLQVVDGLVKLLQSFDYLGDPALGKMWDRSLIYVATDFGRDKNRPFGSEMFGTGHHLNNGSLLLSPMLQGNRVFGGVDPSTLLTYGFDRQTGAPEPGTLMREGDVYSLVAQAMGVDFPGRRDMSAVLAG